MMIKRLRTTAANAADDEPVSFEFDGTLLKIRCGDCLIPGAAIGNTWPSRYILKACQLRDLPIRLKQPEVWFSFWNEKLSIANWSYEGVVPERIE